nr:hypothetical protein [Tanacetum cinerariifolium]
MNRQFLDRRTGWGSVNAVNRSIGIELPRPVTPPDTYSVQALFEGVTDWYPEPRLSRTSRLTTTTISRSSPSLHHYHPHCRTPTTSPTSPRHLHHPTDAIIVTIFNSTHHNCHPHQPSPPRHHHSRTIITSSPPTPLRPPHHHCDPHRGSAATRMTSPPPPQPWHNIPDTFANISSEKYAHCDVEAKAIILILTRIGDDIYLTVDAYTTAKDLWIAIERDGESIKFYYSRFYKMMNEMVRNKLEVSTMQVNVRFLQQLQPEWSRFVTVVKKIVNFDKESYHMLFDILKQYHNEVNEILPEKIAKTTNPLALVAATQHHLDTYYQASKSHKSYASPAKTSSSNRSHATTKNKGKEIAKPITPLLKLASEEDSDMDQA